MTSWSHASSKLGNIKPETRKIVKEVFDAAQRSGHDVWFLWGMGTGEHGTGRGIDFMVRNKAAGDFVKSYIWNNRSRFHLQHIIWRQHIRSTTTSPGVDRKMANRGNTTANHFDHNHVLFRAGAYSPPKSTPKGKKSVTTIAKEVLAGKWGNGAIRKTRLLRSGYNYTAVQNAVGKLSKKKSVTTIAKEVILGKWSTGATRTSRLQKAGYDAGAVQREVNRLLR